MSGSARPKIKSILVLGLGNPLQGDDGIGGAVVAELERRPLPGDVEVLDSGTPGIGLVNLLDGRTRVIIVDAADMGRAPGEVVRLTPDQVRPDPSMRSFSLHAAGLADALMLAQTLGLRLPEITIYGVQPAFIGWRQGLSPEVEAAVPRVVEAVWNQVGA